MDKITEILIIDDTAENIVFLELFLKKKGYIVQNSTTGSSAIEFLSDHPVDLILLDIGLPDIDGFEVCRTIKGIEKLKHIPIIFLSAYSDVENRIKGLQAGATDYLYKPFSKDELLARINTHLEISNLNLKLKESNLKLQAANERLEESEKRLKTIIQTIPDILLHLDKSGKFVTYYQQNKEFYKPPEEFINKTIYDIFEADFAKNVQNQIDNCLEKGSSEFYYGLFFDELKYYFAKFSKLNENEVLAVIRDITELKQIEFSLKESESRFKNMFERHNSIMLIIDPESEIIVDANISACKFYGYTKEQLSQMKTSKISLQSRERIFKDRQDAIFEKRNQFVVPHKLSNGQIRMVEVHASPIDFMNKKLLFSIISDVTEKYNAEKQLIASEEKFRKYITISPIAIFIIDENRKFTFVNPAGCFLLNYSLDEICGITFENVLPKRLKEFAVKQFNELHDTLSTFSTETLFITKDGIVLNVEVDGIKLSDNEYIGFVKEITIKKQYENYLKHLNSTLETRVKERTAEIIKKNRDLAESEQQLELIFNNSPSVMMLLDENLNLIRINKAGKDFACDEFRLPIENMLSCCNNDINGRGCVKNQGCGICEFRRWIQEVVAKGQSISNSEFNLIDTNQDQPQIRYFHLTTIFKWLRAKKIVLAVINEITSMKITEQKLRESEEQYRLLFENMSSGFGLFEFTDENMTDLRTLNINHRASEMFNLDPQFVKGKTLKEIYNDKLNINFQQLLNSLKESKTIELEYFSDDINLWLNLNTFSPRHHQIAIIYNDITNRKLAEESARTLKHAVEQSNVAVVIFNKDFIIEYANPFVYKPGTVTKEMLLGNQIQVFEKVFLPTFNFKKIRENLIASNNWEGELIKKEGNNYTFYQVTISPLNDENGNITHYVAVATDITLPKELEKKILQTIVETEEKERARFSMDLHDGINPLLAAARMYVQCLANPDTKLDKNEILVNIIKLLDEARESIRHISFNLSPHILQNFGLVDAIQAFADKIKNAGNIEINIHSEVKEKFDSTFNAVIYRVLCECFNNTLKYANATKIEISFKYYQNSILIEYVDNGVGFEYNDSYFNSTGTGIYNMKNRIKIINGNIQIISKSKLGTRIVIRIDNFFNFENN